MSFLENQFAGLWLYHYPDIDLVSEYQIVPKRKFRWDFAHIESKVAIEINGQIWRKGGHSSGRGLMRDYTKQCLASSLGWRVFPLSSEMITIKYLQLIANAIEKLKP